LEHRLKSPLLERSPKGVELTPAGATLLIHAKALLLQLNQMQADMDDHGAGRKGQLRILANTSAMTQYVPDDLARFSQANPDVRLIVEERWSAQIVSTLLAGEADVGIIMEGLCTDGLETFAYRSDHLAVVVPPDHPLAVSDYADSRRARLRPHRARKRLVDDASAGRAGGERREGLAPARSGAGL